MRLWILAITLIALGMGACSTSGSGPGTPSQRNLVTSEELAPFLQLTVYEALERLRPRWLQARRAVSARDAGPQRAQVVIDGMPAGGLDRLRSIRVQEVHEVRFLSAGDATSRYGTGYVVGAIEVRTKR
jgi:hypothetical protein